MEFVVGPILALLIGMKFSDYKTKELEKKLESVNNSLSSVVETVDKKIVEQNTLMSQQTLRIMAPVAKSVARVNEQLGLQ